MKKDLTLLSKIFTLSVVMYNMEQSRNKSDQESSGSELHARDRYAVADKIESEFERKDSSIH